MKALRRWTEGLCAAEVPSLWLPVAPIVSIAGEDTGFSLLKQDLAAIAIVFDFHESSASPLAADRQGKQAVAR